MKLGTFFYRRPIFRNYISERPNKIYKGKSLNMRKNTMVNPHILFGNKLPHIIPRDHTCDYKEKFPESSLVLNNKDVILKKLINHKQRYLSRQFTNSQNKTVNKIRMLHKYIMKNIPQKKEKLILPTENSFNEIVTFLHGIKRFIKQNPKAKLAEYKNPLVYDDFMERKELRLIPSLITKIERKRFELKIGIADIKFIEM